MLNDDQRAELREQLSSLHELLEETDQPDSSTLQSMQLVAADLAKVLEQQPEDDYWGRLRKSWHEAALNFESHHPRLTQVVDQISSILASVGI